ncbi:MAG: hypothetical protein M3356_02275 [Actinomycetota bacterium]|nr:hypothetical protein [Actinomycetota bacterium]
MNIYSKTASIAAILALTAAPAFAVGPPAGTPSPNQNSTSNPGTAHKLAAPGQFCKAESKKKAEGQERSDFSTCVRAQAKLRSGKTDSPREACKEADKKHVKGEKGTAFSRCVSAGAKLLKDERAQDEQAEGAPVSG